MSASEVLTVERFDAIVRRCNPSLWRLRVKGGQKRVDVYLPMPLHRDWRGAIVAELGSGSFNVRMLRKPGAAMGAERRKLGLKSATLPWCGVNLEADESDASPEVVEDNEREVPAPPKRRATFAAIEEPASDGEGQELRAARELRAQAEKVRAETELAEAKRALDATRGGPSSFAVPGAAPAGADAIGQVVRVFETILAAQAKREEAIVAELRALRQDIAGSVNAAPAAATAQPTEELRRAIGLVKDVLTLSRDLPGAEAGEGNTNEIAQVLREGRGLLAQMFDIHRATPQPAPKGAPRAGGAMRKVPANADDVKRVRVAEFVRGVVHELTSDSDPARAAELLEPSAALLPSSLREAILGHGWQAAWQACAEFLPPAQWKEIDGVIASNSQFATWLGTFATEIAAIWNDDEDGDGDGDGDGVEEGELPFAADA